MWQAYTDRNIPATFEINKYAFSTNYQEPTWHLSRYSWVVVTIAAIDWPYFARLLLLVSLWRSVMTSRREQKQFAEVYTRFSSNYQQLVQDGCSQFPCSRPIWDSHQQPQYTIPIGPVGAAEPRLFLTASPYQYDFRRWGWCSTHLLQCSLASV
jgi:hypothetical protein